MALPLALALAPLVPPGDKDMRAGRGGGGGGEGAAGREKAAS
jgi:hypothetical protein